MTNGELGARSALSFGKNRRLSVRMIEEEYGKLKSIVHCILMIISKGDKSTRKWYQDPDDEGAAFI